mgnify:CR=1 FL=1
MESELTVLERKREGILKQINEIGDLRRGSISAIFRRCGKVNCVCMKDPEHGGHGPVYFWSVRIKGKSYARNFKIGSMMEKYRKETDNFRKYSKLNSELVTVNEKICDLRPVLELEDEAEESALKKKLQRMFKARLQKR